jgi:hypothetical protein
MRKNKWAYGITTTPARERDLLPRTLDSLARGGFDNPRLFIDDCRMPFFDYDYERFGLEVTVRDPQIRTFGNWALALWELYVREPGCQRYAIFQDDLVTYPNLRQYLDNCVYPTKGYWNLYTFPVNQELAPLDGQPCWYPSNQLGKGAVALVFSRQAVTTLLSSEYFVGRPQNAHRGWRAVDGAIVSAFKKVGWREYVHNPSLVEHTGQVSSMGGKKHPVSLSFRGEEFDAMELVT